MLVEQPLKGFCLGQLVFDAWERQTFLLSSQLPARITIKNDAISRNQERVSKREVTLLRKRGQFGGWNGEMMPNITWMRMEFFQPTGYEPAMEVVCCCRCIPSLCDVTVHNIPHNRSGGYHQHGSDAGLGASPDCPASRLRALQRGSQCLPGCCEDGD